MFNYLQVGSFELKVKRSATGTSAGPVVAAAAAPAAAAHAEPEPLPVVMETTKTVEESVDESVIYITSPKVYRLTSGSSVNSKAGNTLSLSAEAGTWAADSMVD